MGPKITALHLKSLIGVIVKPAAKNLLHLLLQVAGHVAERVEHLHLLLLLLLLNSQCWIVAFLNLADEKDISMIVFCLDFLPVLSIFYFRILFVSK